MPNRWCDGLEVCALASQDLPAVVQLEQQELSPWRESQVVEELTAGNRAALIATVRGTVVGWCCSRRCDTEAEVLKIGVARHCRRQGVGTRLLAQLERELLGCGVQTLFLEVRATHGAAVSFYRSSGYVVVGRRPRYYRDPVDDALIMSKKVRQGGVTT